MGRTIELTVNEKVYVLEFNRKTLLLCANLQEDLKNAKTPLEQYSVFSKFIYFGLIKNQPEIKVEEVEEIIENIDDFEGFTKALNEIIESSVNTLKEHKGNAHWVVK